MQPAIYIAELDDLEDLTKLVLAFRDFFGYTEPTEVEYRVALTKLLEAPDAEFYLARGQSGEALGYACLRTRFSAWANGLEGEIEDFFVCDAARGQGIGSALLRFTLERAMILGCPWLHVCTNERNQGAIALYESLGFRCTRSIWNDGKQLQLIKNNPLL
jgi:GNAT superfamily N-acetyltransferase